MMKRFLIGLLAVSGLLTASTASAQVYESRAYVKKTTITKEEKKTDTCPFKKTQWYGRVGVGIPVVTGAAGVSGDARFDLDFGFQRRMGCKGWYWGMDFAFITNSMTVKSGTYDAGGYMMHRDGETKTTVGGRWHLSNFGWRKIFGDCMLDVHFGLAIATYGDIRMEKVGAYEKVMCIGVEPTIPIGVGFRWKKLMFDFTVMPNLAPYATCTVRNGYDQWGYYDTRDFDTHSTNLLISVGYAF